VNTSLRKDDVAAHLIGVIDIRHGLAVHAIAGQRAQYQPARADGVPEGDALQLAARYLRLGVKSLYIADLDAICEGLPNARLLAELASGCEHCIIDAGSAVQELSYFFASQPHVRFVLPTESFGSLEQWTKVCMAIDSEKVVLGLDLNGNQVRLRHSSVSDIDSPHASIGNESDSDLWQNISPWIDRARELHLPALLVLDLTYVGASKGPGCLQACRLIQSHKKDLPIISGGGVRTREDVTRMRLAGCDHVLVGTSLHHDDSAMRLFGVD
jgi:phosphoribosylformimino-5-aminoimidazole carboxamide ribotide isomerase